MTTVRMGWISLLLLTALAACSPSDPKVQSASESLSAGSPSPKPPPFRQDRFRITKSETDFDTTLSALLTALDRRDLTIFAIIDHAASAQSVDLELSPMTLVIFGNPKMGIPLMQKEPLLGAELPMRALVYEQDGETFVAMTGMGFLERSYRMRDQAERFDKMAKALEAIAIEATGP